MSEAAAPPPMTVVAFLEWDEEQEGRHELLHGEPIAMAPERIGHSRAKMRAVRALADGIAERGLPCEAIMDGVGIATSDTDLFQPDAIVHCGAPLDGDLRIVPDPVILVEVTSPSNSRVDLVRKLPQYFRLPSLRHYLIVMLKERVVLHHQRMEDGRIETAILGSGAIRLDPPGITVQADELLGP